MYSLLYLNEVGEPAVRQAFKASENLLHSSNDAVCRTASATVHPGNGAGATGICEFTIIRPNHQRQSSVFARTDAIERCVLHNESHAIETRSNASLC
jgi:hypothetical protein